MSKSFVCDYRKRHRHLNSHATLRSFARDLRFTDGQNKRGHQIQVKLTYYRDLVMWVTGSD
ncbi:MAG: hypothetical protein DMG14_00020 [Acidobacteria bacterium]|nr:MAG: hypothetical protein DMG14_00020 [Acidobacteriota bacterium]